MKLVIEWKAGQCLTFISRHHTATTSVNCRWFRARDLNLQNADIGVPWNSIVFPRSFRKFPCSMIYNPCSEKQGNRAETGSLKTGSTTTTTTTLLKCRNIKNLKTDFREKPGREMSA